MISLFEDHAKVPLYKRTIAQDPFAPGAEGAQPRVFAATIGAVPLRHLLWVSPHRLFILREDPRRFVLIDLKSQNESDLPELSQRWADEELFDPDMLALSPDGAWLLGCGGTADQPTWVASEVAGDGWQEWPRNIPAAQPRFVLQRNPLMAWIDNERWAELNYTRNGYVARVRTRGVDAVTELPLDVPTYLPDFPSVQFAFPQQNEGRIGGEVGVTTRGLLQDNHFVTQLLRVIRGRESWRVEESRIVWPRAEHPGSFKRCVLSPDGTRLAWNCYFSATEARAIIVSDSQGKNSRIVYEHLYPLREHKAGRAESMWNKSLEWTPEGDGLLFWRGSYGENGLCLLPVSFVEL